MSAKSRKMSMNAIESMSAAEITELLAWQDGAGLSVLHIAIRNKKVSQVAKLVSLGADCTMPDSDGNTPLHFAAECGDLQILNIVADATDDLDVQNNEGETPVILAAHAGFIGAVVSLTSMEKHVVPADTSITDLKGRTLLMHACISGDIDLVRLMLINKDGNSQRMSISRVAVNAVDVDRISALMYAAMEGHWYLVSLLVLNKANVAAKDVNGFTALHWASAHGNAPTVSALIDCGAVVNECDNENWTSIMHAVNENNLEIVQLLLDSDANPDHTVGLANSHPMHLTLCDAVRERVVGSQSSPLILNGRLIVSILRATDLYIDPSSVTDGSEDILVYAVVQFKASGDAADSEMVAITPGVRLLSHRITKSIEWNEPIVFFFRDREVKPDCMISIELFATRNHHPFDYLFNMQHAAGEDEGEVHVKRDRMDQLYREVQLYEKSVAMDKIKEDKMDSFNFTDLKKRWNQIRETRKRLEKYRATHIPLPPVPLTHFPCGSVSLSFSRLREVFRGNLVAFNRYPRAVDRGMLRFDIDYVPSFIVPKLFRDAQPAPVPQTPKSSELEAVEAPESLFVFKPTPDDLDRFAPRAVKLAKQSRDHYADWWGRSTITRVEKPKKFHEIQAERVKAINIMAQAMLSKQV